MKLTSSSFLDGARIPEAFAFGKLDPKTHIALSQNRNPDLAWADVPSGTRSLVLICRDYDVPSRPDDVNQEGRVIPASLPRVDFYHWVLVDLDPKSGPIRPGEFSDGVTARGKKGPDGPRATRQGSNDYTTWFASDQDMSGEYFGYDGPCPPWNDTIVHHYVFTLYALDLDRCPVTGVFKGPDVLAAIRGHVLAEAEITGIYSLNPKVKS
ncbi:MAG: YbhB/YbcL family Raf kinase inhibitor-like protein [Betaproteobacteria bacterium]|nr:MAG: phospholipid-binding protein [Betaproteobacteria bacterium SG8_41]UCF74851.1 MAG: YbhB/YbcL family Raf kinase inhibitor-like protein [Betaproteobacteria bacterium]